ncbi:MAG TPA: hypothetical protein VG206_08630 [Terriglobia bacterium]|nr:hypothetical protein [Terriglobia bacterium]
MRYVGTHGTHLIGDSFRTLNPVPIATRPALRGNINNPAPTDATIGAIFGCGTSCPGSLVLKAFPEWDPLTGTVSPDGYNRYDAFEAKLEKRYSHGLNVLVAWTIQKNIVSPDLTGLEGSNLSPRFSAAASAEPQPSTTDSHSARASDCLSALKKIRATGRDTSHSLPMTFLRSSTSPPRINCLPGREDHSSHTAPRPRC